MRNNSRGGNDLCSWLGGYGKSDSSCEDAGGEARLFDVVQGNGAERGRFELMPCGVSRHEFHKDGKEFTIYINTKGETVSVPESNLTLAPHELRIYGDGIPHA